MGINVDDLYNTILTKLIEIESRLEKYHTKPNLKWQIQDNNQYEIVVRRICAECSNIYESLIGKSEKFMRTPPYTTTLKNT